MPRFIEQFYYGNIEPQEHTAKMSESVRKLRRLFFFPLDMAKKTCAAAGG